MLNNEFPPLGGGTASVNLAILNEFAKMPDVSVDLVTSAAGSKYEEERFSDNIRIFRVPVRARNIHHASNRELLEYSIRGFLKAYSLTRRFEYQSCLAWCTVPAGAVALLLYRLRRIPYLVRVSGPDLPGFEKRYQATVRILLPLLRHTWRKARCVVVKCKAEREILDAVCPELKLETIPNGVDTSVFYPRTEPRHSDKPFTFLSVGRLIERKGQHLIIEAMRELRSQGIEARLILIGEGDNREKYQALIDRYQLNDWIELCGYVPREKMPEVYRKADCFVLPSEAEGMSVALLEAIASGLRLVATSVGGIAEMPKELPGIYLLSSPEVSILTKSMRDCFLSFNQNREASSVIKMWPQSYTWGNIAWSMRQLLSEAAKS